MNFEEIKQLHEMGFTPDQIMSLRGGQTEPEPEEPEQEQTEPAEPEEPEQEQDNGPDLTGLQNQIEEQRKQIETLTKELQKSNRQNMRVNSLPENDLMTQTDKIMAELIRPTIKEENK